MAQKTIFLTGAAGFIGFHLAKKLLAEGHNVIGLDNFNDYYTPSLKRDRAKQLKSLGLSVIEGDINDKTLLEDLFQTHNFTHVLHMAAQAGVRYSMTHPDSYIASNIQGFVSLLEVCKQQKGLPFIYASSSSVYGCNTKVPFSIDDPTDHPANLYGATKKANELIAYAYHHLYDLKMTGLRFFTVYGPWGRPDMAYFSFTKALLEGTHIPLFNHGHMRRDFTYIDDIVNGTLQALELAAPFEVFNLGNCNPEPLSYFVKMLEKATGKKALIDLLPMQPGDMESTYADIGHSKKMLGFSPTTSLEEGLSNFVQWYRSYYDSTTTA